MARGGSFRQRESTFVAIAGSIPTLVQYGVDDATWAVTAAARNIPGTRCLAFALALRGMLAQAGIHSELRIGVAPGPHGTITAHAWLHCGTRDLAWGDSVENFSQLRTRMELP